MNKKYTIKQLLLSGKNWWNFYNNHKDRIRPAIIKGIVKTAQLQKYYSGLQRILLQQPKLFAYKKDTF